MLQQKIGPTFAKTDLSCRFVVPGRWEREGVPLKFSPQQQSEGLSVFRHLAGLYLEPRSTYAYIVSAYCSTIISKDKMNIFWEKIYTFILSMEGTRVSPQLGKELLFIATLSAHRTHHGL